MSEGKEVWLARDKSDFDFYVVYEKDGMPEPNEYGNYYGGVEQFCSSLFERITGYKLSPGECRRVRIKIEEVK